MYAPRSGTEASGPRMCACAPSALPFRRESPGTGRLPGASLRSRGHRVNNKPQYVSRQGLEDLRAELEELVNVRRAEVAARIQEAKEHGDISENAEYEDAKNEQAFIEGRIQGLSALIKNAVIIDEHTSTTHVQIGSTVELQGDAGKETYTIVGLGGGGARVGSHLQRVAGRPRPAGQEEGRQDHGVGPGRGPGVQDPRDQLIPAGEESRTMFWADELAATLSGPQVVNDSKTPSGHRPRGQPPGRRAPRRHRARPARPRPARPSSATASTTSTRWTPRRS